MSFDWLSYLGLAEHLFKEAGQLPNQDACYRSVASRAYYAVFCTARNYIRESDGVTVHGHQEVQEHLKRHPGNKARCKIGNQLKQLHQSRKKVDYDNDLHALAFNTASQALTWAKKIRDGLVELSS